MTTKTHLRILEKRRLNLSHKVSSLKADSVYNRKRIFSRAWYFVRVKGISLGEALRMSWRETKEFRLSALKELDKLKSIQLNLFTPSLPVADFKESYERIMSIVVASGERVGD